MAGVKEIKSHIKSISDTQKITNAMYLISSTKLRTAKEMVLKTDEYYSAIEEIIKILATVDSNNPFMRENDSLKKACLVLASDKGLAGDYNKQIINYILNNKDDSTECLIIGNTVKKFFISHNISFVDDFNITIKSPDYETAKQISEYLRLKYLDGTYNKIEVVFMDFEKGINDKILTRQLLPVINHKIISEKKYEFIPSKEEILDSVIPEYITLNIYNSLVKAYCSEQNARMKAMDSANQNAKSLLEELNVQYNRMRQNSITQEITEISGGKGIN